MRGREIAAGLFAVAGAAIVAGLLVFIRGYALSGARYYLILGETMGLEKGAPVRMAGVEVGRVAGVELTPEGEAKICMAVSRKVRLYTGYDYTVSRGALLGEPYVRITPREPRGRLLRPGETVRGRDPILIEDALVRSQGALMEFGLMARDLRAELGDMVATLSEATQSARRLSARLEGFLGEAERAMEGSGRRLELALSEARRMAGSLGRAARAAERLLSTPGLPEDIRAALRSVKEAGESAQSLAGSLEALLSDRELWGNLRAAAKGAREAAERARATLERARRVVERLDEGLRKAERAEEALRSVSTRYEAKAVFGSRPRLSADFHVRLGDYVAGVRDVGGRSEVELQKAVGRGRGSLYLGLVRGKPGLGYDLGLGRRGAVRLDLYGTDRIKADLRARRRLGRRTDLVVEWRGVGSDNEIGIGVGYER